MKGLLRWYSRFGFIVTLAGFTVCTGLPMHAVAAPVPGGSLDPLLIPKYVQPLVIPPQMPKSADVNTPAADYNIAIRQFKQQILPGGAWNVINGRADTFPATTVWGYGRAEDAIPSNFVAPVPLNPASPLALPGQGISFNYPAFTIENTTAVPNKVRWINDLVVDPVACGASADKTIAACNFLPHLFNVDQTLHWANPPKANCVPMPGMMSIDPNSTDCHTMVPEPYTGPVPLVTHVHGAHVQPDSDGYPESWWLPGTPGTKGIPASYGDHGSAYTQSDYSNTVPGSAFYEYENTQPATTLWFHDHALGMTRLNVYAGPAGFWLIRGGAYDTAAQVLPGPAPSGSGDPNFDAAYRATIREIPIVIQDRSFNADGSLFYPADRSFFDGFTGPYIGTPAGTPAGPSDISWIWNPEAFFNTMVVNGTTWPKFDVAPVRYRLRLLDGCNSRTLNLSLREVADAGADGVMGTTDDTLGAEVPIYQIGSDQGFLPQVVKIETGHVTSLPGNGTIPAHVDAADPNQALLMGPAERADVIIDFTGLANKRIRMINTAPDSPFGGFPTDPADPATTGQVMDFVVSGATAADPSTPVTNLVLPAEASLGASTKTRQVSLNEMVSDQVCVEIDGVTGEMTTLFNVPAGTPDFTATCLATPPSKPGNIVDLAGPRQALLGVVISGDGGSLVAAPRNWSDPITENPTLDSTETWEIYNTTMDAHPIHMHLVRYEVVNRQDIDPNTLKPIADTATPPRPNELGYKDTVIAYPGQVTRLKAKFDIAGLYVWHCHIVEHEDNEMMRPYVVSSPAGPVSKVVSTTPSGSFRAGDAVTVIVAFNQPVTTSGLTMLLNTGASIDTGALMHASAVSGTYTVAAGESAAALNVSRITGTVTDFAGNASVNPSIPAGANLADSKTIKIDAKAPVVSPGPLAGTYENSLSITLSADETAVIYVTTDGTTPTATASNLYTGPIALTPAATTTYSVNYFAVDQAGNSSAVQTSTYIVHVSDLVGSIKINGGAPSTTTALVSLTLSATDPAGVPQMQFSNDGVTYTALEAYATSKAWQLTPGDGLKTVYVRFKDGNGILYTFTANIIVSAAATRATGDLNGDNSVDLKDALKALQISIGLFAATTDELVRGDVAPLVNGVPKPDGIIDITDSLLILRRSVGLITW